MAAAGSGDLPRVVFVGSVGADIVFEVSAYPSEDSEIRASAMHRRRGGNAANSACVAGQLLRGLAAVSLVANLPSEDPFSASAAADLAECGADTSHCPTPSGCSLPLTSIMTSLATGSRTCVTFRDAPELVAAPVEAAIRALRPQWVHFEARGTEEATGQMMRAARAAGAVVSVEMEKRRCAGLLQLADIAVCSSDFATWQGGDPTSFIKQCAAAGRAVIVTQGAKGALHVDGRGGAAAEVKGTPAHPPPGQIVDSVAAGDTFNAALVAAFVRCGASELAPAVEYACRVASCKIARRGLRFDAAELQGELAPPQPAARGSPAGGGQ
eukprot:TRINITY_DN8429_c0_g1_i1.p1 TRINITY_DN8429_c0_g1~~TRINITY_DN8429_c0_g1_i1.p1  ORF type:complete len:353 (+),score=85.45 TRINITY_DN8429_c0_g1_i1:83-1060(+)